VGASCLSRGARENSGVVALDGGQLGLEKESELVLVTLLEHHVGATTCLLALPVLLALELATAGTLLGRKWLSTPTLLLGLNFLILTHVILLMSYDPVGHWQL